MLLYEVGMVQKLHMKSLLGFPRIFLLFGKDISLPAVFAEELCIR